MSLERHFSPEKPIRIDSEYEQEQFMLIQAKALEVMLGGDSRAIAKWISVPRNAEISRQVIMDYLSNKKEIDLNELVEMISVATGGTKDIH